MTQHEGKRHWELAQRLIGEHGDVPCYDAVVRCDHERAAVHAALAQAHALAAIAASLEQFVHLFGLYESVPGEMGQVLTLAREPEPADAQCPETAFGRRCERLSGHLMPHCAEGGIEWTGSCPADGCMLDEQHPGDHEFVSETEPVSP